MKIDLGMELGKEEKTKIMNRLKRIEGQAKGIQRMLEEGQDCQQVIIQLKALRSAVQNASQALMAFYLECYVDEQVKNGVPAKKALEKAMEMLANQAL
ncbi:MAG: metal-sensitive transcriptional regulator [Syntrophomonadaceae bacterium]|nr:metal-sensitive transcriptional regulator [Syntrophomonadaceae bacterium]